MFGRQQKRCDYAIKDSLFLRYALHATLFAWLRALSSTDSPPFSHSSLKDTHTPYSPSLKFLHAFLKLSCTQFSRNATPKHPLYLICSDALYIHTRPKDILIQAMTSTNKRISYWLAHSPNAVKTAPHTFMEATYVRSRGPLLANIVF